ncbi:MAG: hypothetical protein JNM26_18445 [Ideonella sp.]|nr:hypothetical protein [Ideonella sp.]
MLKIHCINLDRRADRWAQCQANYESMGLSPSAVRRVSAVEDTDFGALGCAKSHVAVLSHFLTQESAPYCLVLEDDFDLIRPFSDVVGDFNRLATERVDWDALLLVGTSVIAGPRQEPGIARVVESQCTAGYLVGRRYAPALLACFAESIPLLENLRRLEPRHLAVSRLAIDVAWKRLQRRDRWYIFTPSMGRQRPSFSDIEQRVVNYDAETYAMA